MTPHPPYYWLKEHPNLGKNRQLSNIVHVVPHLEALEEYKQNVKEF